ncbi:MAG TPA: ABC transporter permease [Intrasporangium sp.]|uniref:ABC transporter permease n=1 Tax=Intrasporangium sp. TaxID=1925024 RepID=UPI002D77E0A8|nr:ABC transporter permease [Intrasporangium sp.]HET7399515.1 ABC transporter permease [Intrasporangium sp.]
MSTLSGAAAEIQAEVSAPLVDPSRPPEKHPPGRSPSQIALGRLRRDKMAMACLGVVVFFILVAVLAPVLSAIEGQNYADFNTDLVDAYLLPVIGPTSSHWFGVEPATGRDLFAQWAYGARPSLTIAFVASAITSVVGVTMGLLSGFLGGWVDRVISWVVDFVLSLNYLLIAIAVVPIIVSIKGGIEVVSAEDNANIRFFSLIGVLAFFGWASLARLIRGEVLSLREREFVQAAKVLGVPTRRTLARELLPNLVAPIVIQFSLAVPAYIVAEAGLSFLGVGLIDPIPSWGQLISRAQNYYSVDPLYLWIPVFSVSVLTLALSWLGDSVRDAFDPRTRR